MATYIIKITQMDYSVCMYVPPISVIVTEYNISVKLDKTLVQYIFFCTLTSYQLWKILYTPLSIYKLTS